MNDIFSIKRFALSFQRIMIERGVKMFGSILLIILVIFLFVNINITPGVYGTLQQVFLTLGLTFGPVIFMSLFANEFTNSSKGISYLLLPASRLEKWFLNSVVIIGSYYVVFGILFRLMDLWMISRINTNFNLAEGTLNVMSFTDNLFIIPMMLGSCLAMMILLGSYYFKKNAMIFSLLISFGVLLLIMIIDHFVANGMSNEAIEFGNSAPFSSIYIKPENTASSSYALTLPYSEIGIASRIFIPLFICLSGIYFVRIKEKQL